MPLAFSQAQYYAGLLGRALLFLRLFSLLPKWPRYTLACLSLMVVFKFSQALAHDYYPVNIYHIVLVVAASRGADVRISLKIFFAYLLFFLLSCPITLALGWSEPVLKHLSGLQGSSLGFKNPNTRAQFIMAAVFLGLVLAKERRTKVIWLVCWVASAATFLLTLNLTPSLLLLVMPLVYIIVNKRVPKPILLSLLPPACLLISIILAAIFGPGYGSTTFGSRFSIPALVFRKYGLSPFGQDCGLPNWFGGEPPYNLTIDNVYLNLCLCDGVVVAIVVIILLSWLLYLIGKKGDPLLSTTACCFTIAGLMEPVPYNILINFTLLFFPALLEEYPLRESKAAGFLAPALALGALLYYFWPWPGSSQLAKRDHPYGTVSDIAAPEGFVASEPSSDSFGGFLDNIPLARPDSALALYDGTPAEDLRYQCYRILDYPLIDNNEQCADVCMRLKAEYLYERGLFRNIRFADTRGKALRYRFGACRPQFEHFLKEVFNWCNTESLRNSLPVQIKEDLAPGDIFIYDKNSRPGEVYGHAVMIARTAVDTVSGRQAVLLLQGSTPACDLHIVSNTTHPELSPWHILDNAPDSIPILTAGKSVFFAKDLRGYQ